MQPEKNRRTTCIKQGNLHMEIGGNVNKEQNKNTQAEFAEYVIKSEKAANGKNLKIKEHQANNSEKNKEILVKRSKSEKQIVDKNVHFIVSENVCSEKCEALHVNFGQLSSLNESRNCRLNNTTGCIVNLNTESLEQGTSRIQESVLSDEVNFCCGNLKHSGIISAKFSMLISIILLVVSVHKFFRSSGDDEGNTKILVFFAAVYALCYVHCSRKLISGIHKELKQKFIAWIGFSILTALFLFSGAIYVLIYYWDDLIEFRDDVFVNCQVLAFLVCLVVFGCILLYCTRIVLLLWRSMHFEEESHNGSCFDLIRAFGALHAFSLNSFSHAAAH